jgi:hypothetical protein
LQQHESKNIGEESLQDLFEELVYKVIPQCLRSRTKTMIKKKGKVPIEEYVEKLIKKKTMFKVKETQKML